MAFGLLSLVMILPFTLLVFRYQPADMGLAPYGAEEAQAQRMQAHEPEAAAVRPGLLMLAGLTALYAVAMFTSAFNQHLASFGASVGFAGAAMLVSVSMVGNMLGKLALGLLADRTGPAKAAFISFGMALAGFVIIPYTGWALYAAAFLTGMILPSATVLMPLLVQHAYNDRGYEQAYAYISTLGSVVYAFAGSIMGYLFDMKGDYALVIQLCALLLAAALGILAPMCMKRRRA